ncbi:MAG TPA: hypothetical protein PK867_29640, partial [Pirellulales bacterium]|nr:hypothetical protein [Pirellulales bacterium]
PRPRPSPQLLARQAAVPFPSDMLTGVIFGCRTSDADKAMVREWVASIGRAVAFYRAKQRDGAFALDIDLID